MDYIEQNVNSVRQRVAAAARRAGRNPEDVTIIAVSKFVETDKIQRAVDLGLNILAENRVQEMNEKYPVIKGAVWHIIGHLQTNKVRYAVGRAELIHSVDSLRLLEEINHQAERLEIIQDFLLELNISGEESKYGLTNEEFRYIINKLNDYGSVRLRGIMAMAPNFEDKELCRPVFRKALELFDELKTNDKNIDVLSMGMSGDFEIAVEEGATHVRIGSAIFKELS
ncbi:MAG: YggS family pyridoxal phosphate-dependent enzyme [Clostridia bacterium]